MSSFGEVLAEFKAKSLQEPENIAPLVDDQTLMNGLVAWKSVRVTYRKPTICIDQDETGKWEWLWTQIEFDASAFAAVSGVRQQDVMSLVTRLKGLRLVFPDGTINTLAKNYLQSIILSKINKNSKKSSPKPIPTVQEN